MDSSIPHFAAEKDIIDAHSTLLDNSDDVNKEIGETDDSEEEDEIDDFVVTDSAVNLDEIATCESSADDDEEIVIGYSAVEDDVIATSDFAVEGRISSFRDESDETTTTCPTSAAQDELEVIKRELQREKRKRKKERQRFFLQRQELETRIESVQNKLKRNQDKLYRQRSEFREDYERKVNRCLHLEDEKFQRDMFVKEVIKVLSSKSEELRKLKNPLSTSRYYGNESNTELDLNWKYTPKTPLSVRAATPRRLLRKKSSAKIKRMFLKVEKGDLRYDPPIDEDNKHDVNDEFNKTL